MSALNILYSPGDPEGEGEKLPGRTVNVSCLIAINLEWLNMQRIAALGGIGLQYNPGCFVAGMLRMRVRPPPYSYGKEAPMQVVTALIYHTSNIMLTGASNVYVARSAAWLFCRLLNERINIPAIVYNFRVENIVCNFYLRFKVNLPAFAASEGTMRCSYDPDSFPAAIYYFGHKFAALVNGTGRIIITGSRDQENTAQKYDILYDKLCKFREPYNPSGIFAIGELAAGASRELANYKAPKMKAKDRQASYMEMNAQFTMLMQSFTEHDIERIDEDAPEFGIMPFIRNYDAHRPVPPTVPNKRRKKKNSEVPRAKRRRNTTAQSNNSNS